MNIANEPRHAKSRFKHFAKGILSEERIDRLFRYEPPVEDTRSAAEKAAGIAEQYADLVLEPTTPRTDRDIKREIRAVLPEIPAEMRPVRHIPGEGNRRISD